MGVASPEVKPIEAWADEALAPSDAALKGAKVQSETVREWLQSFDEAASRTLIRMLKQLLGGATGYVPPV